MQTNIDDVKDSCFGCTACKEICPVKAIQMQADSEGFLMPFVDQNRCVKCGLCRKVCPAINRWRANSANNIIDVYAFENPDKMVLNNSTSGGFFSYAAMKSCADKICGCVQDSDLKIKHVVKEATSGIKDFRGSKYVQSDLGDCFAEIKNLLEKDQKVLFSGTSCQVHGLLNYLKETKTTVDNLMTLDIVCHGVPSPKLYDNYLKNYELKKHCKVKKHLFRNKKNGWGNKIGVLNYLQTIITVYDKEDQRSLEANLWQNIFFSDYCIRKSCYSCPYTSVNKPADITMGDFWGVENIFPAKPFKNGCSLVIIRGDTNIDFYDNESSVKIDDLEKVKKSQARLNGPIKKPKDRDDFWNDYNNKGFEYVATKYFNYSRKSRILLSVYFKLVDLRLNKITDEIARKIFF